MTFRGWPLVATLWFTFSYFVPSGEEAENKAVGTLPFRESKQGMILVEASFDKGRNRVFLIDLGSTIDLLLDTSTAAELGLKEAKPTHEETVEGFGDKAIPLNVWRKAVITSHHVRLAEGIHPVEDMSLFGRVVGEPIAGIVGLPIADRYVTEINYDTHQISFYESKHYKPANESVRLPLESTAPRSLLVVKATVTSDDCHSNDVRIYLDTGSDSDLIFGETYTSGHSILFASSQTQQMASVGTKPNEVKSLGPVLLTLGSATLQLQQVFGAEKTSARSLERIADGGIGAPVLRNFNFAIDKQRGMVYLTPRSSFVSVPSLGSRCPNKETRSK